MRMIWRARGCSPRRHVFAGDMDSYMTLRSELEQSEPQEHEELLFVGYSWIAEPSKGLPLIERAITLRESLLAHVLRLQLLSRDALERVSKEQVDAALESLDKVRGAIRAGPDVVGESLVARMVAMQLAQKRGDAKAFTEMRTLAEEACAMLEQNPTYKIGYTVRAWYHDCFDADRADAAWREALMHGLEGWPRFHAAATLFRTNDMQSARRFLNGGLRLERMALAFVLCGQQEYRDEVRRIYRELADPPTTIHFSSGAEIEILAVIDPELCHAEAKSILKSREFATSFDRSMVSFLANEVDVDGLIQAAGDSNDNLAMAYFLVCASPSGRRAHNRS